MKKPQTLKPSKERTGIDRLYKRIGARMISFYYQHPDNKNETLASAPVGDKQAIREAEILAKHKALEIQQGKVIAGSVAELIERFRIEVDPFHYLDQSKEGIAVRKGNYRNLIAFFGKMAPQSLKKIHAYQYTEARAATAPRKAWKEIYALSTICRKAERWGIIEANPFVNLDRDKFERIVRIIYRSQVVRFYLWSQRQENRVMRLMGCMALFAYLTGYRTAEVRPVPKSACSPDGILVTSAKRKPGEIPVDKLREWTPRLRMVVKRIEEAQKYMPPVPSKTTNQLAQIASLIANGESAKRATALAGMKESTYYYWIKRIKKDQRVKPKESDYLFPNSSGGKYTKGGLSSTWQEAMIAYVTSLDPAVTLQTLTAHKEYFSIMNIRPAAITTKLKQRADDAYDFAGHSNPATTHLFYDHREVKRAVATE